MFCQGSTYDCLINLKIYPKLVGLNSSSKNILDFVSQPYLVDRYSATYLIKGGFAKYSKFSNSKGVQLLDEISTSQMYSAYTYLKDKKNFFLIDAHKFGG